MGEVLSVVKMLSREKGIEIADAYRIGKSREQYARMASAVLHEASEQL